MTFEVRHRAPRLVILKLGYGSSAVYAQTLILIFANLPAKSGLNVVGLLPLRKIRVGHVLTQHVLFSPNETK